VNDGYHEGAASRPAFRGFAILRGDKFAGDHLIPIDVKVNGIPMTGLADSAATVSIIAKSFAIPSEPPTCSVEAVNGKRIEVLGGATVQCDFPDLDCSWTGTITVADIAVPLIIGMDILRSIGAVIDEKINFDDPLFNSMRPFMCWIEGVSYYHRGSEMTPA